MIFLANKTGARRLPLLALVFVLGSGIGLLAQSLDSLQKLEETVVRPSLRQDEVTGQTPYSLKPQAAQSLSDLLQRQSPFYIKSYGAGLLGSISLRGSGAAHTSVFWNGVNLQNPMNGQLDFSLVPGFFLDQAQVYSGGSGELFGSGALGGVISLNSEVKAANQTEFAAILGSFGQASGQAGLNRLFGKQAFRIRAFYSKAENNYSFINRGLPGKPEQTLEHAQQDAGGLLADYRYQIKEKQSLDLHYWFQQNKRFLPPTMLEQNSVAEQNDLSHRVVGEFRHSGKLDFLFRAAWLHDELLYLNPAANIHSNSINDGLIQDLEFRKQIKRHRLFASLHNTYYQARQAAYGETRSQWRQALDVAHTYIAKNGKVRTALRQELWKGKAVPFAASLSGELNLKNIQLSSHLAKLYRIPNFNDLYWQPGGNPDIQPEEGFSGEVGIAWKKQNDVNSLQTKLTAYTSLIDNWIIWLPENGIWSAQNIRQVLSRGLEYRLEAGHLANQSYWKLDFNGSFTLTENQKASSGSDLSVGKQLIYVPYWKHSLGLTWNRGNWKLGYRHVWNGGVYTSADNSSWILPWQTGSFTTDYSFGLLGTDFSLRGSIENISNTQYEIMEWRPMPGRWFRLSIHLKI